MEINQYEIYWMNLDPSIGSEIKKTRPCVVISPNEMNRYLRTVIIAPITSKDKAYPTRVSIKLKEKQGWVVLDQIRTVDRRRIGAILGILGKEEVRLVKHVLRECLVD